MAQRLFLILLVSLLLLSCSSEPSDPKAEIRALLAEAEKAVEARSVSQVGDLIADTYMDTGARKRLDIIRLLTGYFLTHQTIHLLVQVDELELINEQQATVILYAATAGQPLTEQTQLFSLRANLIRLELSLAKQDALWKLTDAAWRRANKEDFLN